MKYWVAMVVSFVVMLGINALGGTGNINGQSQADISNKIDVLFTPAGYVFSIWSVIYLLVAVWLVLQFMYIRKNRQFETKNYKLFIGTCIFNILWLFMWHYEVFIVAQIMMFALLINLIILYMNYPKGDQRFGGRLPFSLYTGWISVATIANMSYTLKHYDVSLGVGEVTGTIGLVIIAGLLGITTVYMRRDPFYGLVFVWALIGIAVANDAGSLIITAYISAAIVLVAVIGSFFIKSNPDALTRF